MIFYVTLILAALTLIEIYFRYSRFGRMIHKIPGPPLLPIIGNLPLSFKATDKLRIMMHELQDKYPIYKLYGCSMAMIITRDPDHVKVLLTSKININKDIRPYRNVNCYGDGGILVHNGKFWEHRRKLLNQAFSPKALECYSQVLQKRVKNFIDNLLSHEKVTVHDVSQVFMKFAFGVICEAAMGFDLNNVTEEAGHDFRTAIIEMGEICYYRFARPYIQDWMMNFLPAGRRQKKMWEITKKFARQVIDERRKYHESMGNNVFDEYLNVEASGIWEDEKVPQKNLSILDVLLLNEKKGLIDAKGVLEETVFMIGAGFETTGVAMMFLIILLAENQNAQNLAREELIDVIGGDNNEITSAHINQLEYLDRCTKESMRLFPVSSWIGRSLDEDVQLGKYTIPVGTEVGIGIFDLHRDPHLWPDPLTFDPDRFLPENVKNQHPYAFVPFSKGSRNCIGQKLAMNEVKTIAAHIIHNFHLEAIDRSADFKFDLGVTLQVDKARIRFTKIDKTTK